MIEHPRLQSSRCWEHPGEVTFLSGKGWEMFQQGWWEMVTFMSGKGWEMFVTSQQHCQLRERGCLEPQLCTHTASWGWLQQQHRNSAAKQYRDNTNAGAGDCANSVSQTAPHQYKNKGSSSTEIAFLKSCKWHWNIRHVFYFINALQLLFQALLAGTISKPYQFNKGEDR